MNNEDIEIVYLSDDTNKNKKKKFDFKKYKLPLMVGVPSIILVIIIIFVCTILFNKKEIVLQNIIGEKVRIDTTLDLKGIFESDNNQYSTYKLNNLSKAFISKNKIYYSYSPSYCVYNEFSIPCEELENEKKLCEDNVQLMCSYDDKDNPICEENYCDNLFSDSECLDEDGNVKDLCSSYYNDSTDYSELVTRYVMSADLDGSNVTELRKHELVSPLEFTYTDNKLALYYSNSDDSTYKIDLSNDQITKIKDSYNVFLPLSNSKETVLINYSDNILNLNFYNYNDYSKITKQVSLYNNNKNDNKIRVDAYNKEDFYNISSSLYDPSLNSDYNGVYKNGKLFYQFRNDYKELFLGEKFLYVLTTTGYNIRLLKIDKVTGEEHTPVVILKSNKMINNIEYIATGNDNFAYINVDNSIYIFNSVNDSLTKIDMAFYSIESTGTYNNYIYFYVKSREGNDYYDLVLYNTVTKDEKIINNVEYFTIDSNNLYTVINNENDFELYKYPIY